jgi:hypothetical protein
MSAAQKLSQFNITYNGLVQDIKNLLRNTLEECGYTEDNPFEESEDGSRYLPTFNVSTEYGDVEYDIKSIYLDDDGDICIVSTDSFGEDESVDINDLEYQDLASLLHCLI